MIKWIKKKLLKSIINDIKKEIPEIKKTALEKIEEHKDELLDFIKEKLKQAIKDFVASKVNR
jgi:hypothetical protein